VKATASMVSRRIGPAPLGVSSAGRRQNVGVRPGRQSPVARLDASWYKNPDAVGLRCGGWAPYRVDWHPGDHVHVQSEWQTAGRPGTEPGKSRPRQAQGVASRVPESRMIGERGDHVRVPGPCCWGLLAMRQVVQKPSAVATYQWDAENRTARLTTAVQRRLIACLGILMVIVAGLANRMLCRPPKTGGSTALRRSPHRDGIIFIDWSEDSATLASVSLDGVVQSWDPNLLPSSGPLETLGVVRRVTPASGAHLVLAGDGSLKVISLLSHQVILSKKVLHLLGVHAPKGSQGITEHFGRPPSHGKGPVSPSHPLATKRWWLSRVWGRSGMTFGAD
jgi:hypothetical protein